MTIDRRRRVYTRIAEVMVHISYFSFQGQARLAKEAGVSKSTVSRLIRGKTLPSYSLVYSVTRALEARLGKTLDPRELVGFDDTWPTLSVCELTGCSGCLPDNAYDETGRLKPEYKDIRSGEWSIKGALHRVNREGI